MTSILDGKLIDFDGHAVRLKRSLGRELDMAAPCSKEELLEIHRKLVELNGIDEGHGVSAGHARRIGWRPGFCVPVGGYQTPPTLVLFTQNKPGLADSPAAKKGIKVISRSMICAGAVVTSRPCSCSTRRWAR